MSLLSALPQFRDLTFIWPLLLWLLLLTPGLVWWYLRIDAKQRLTALRYAQLATATGRLDAIGASRAATGAKPAHAPARSNWPRHGPALLLFLAIVILLIAVARPQAMVVLPSRTDAIVLALDDII